MQGRRIHAGQDGYFRTQDVQPGDYFMFDGVWMVKAPNGLMCSLRGNHAVEEHEDGTITVSPSIVIGPGAGPTGWHGFLERGVWREC